MKIRLSDSPFVQSGPKEMTMLAVAFRNFANAPNTAHSYPHSACRHAVRTSEQTAIYFLNSINRLFLSPITNVFTARYELNI